MALTMEIWARILQHLRDTEDGQKDLHAVSRVSQDLNRLAWPMLYKNIAYPADSLKLLNNLVKMPFVTDLIRSVELTDSRPAGYVTHADRLADMTVRCLQVPPNLKARLQSVVDEFSSGVYNGLPTLILSQARKVEHVTLKLEDPCPDLMWLISGSEDIEVRWEPGQRFLFEVEKLEKDEDLSERFILPDLIPPEASTPSALDLARYGIRAYKHYGLPFLTELTLIHPNDGPKMSAYHLVPLMTHRGLQVLSFQGVSYEAADVDSMMITPVQSNLHTFRLSDALFNGKGVKDIFYRFPYLRTLELSSGSPNKADPAARHPVNFRDLGGVLTSVGKHLYVLHLDMRAFRREPSVFWLMYLNRLFCVKKLIISTDCLRNYDPFVPRDEMQRTLTRDLPLRLEELELLEVDVENHIDQD
ncbi:unnamed protein product [Clonostachys chloroleuca]|uniref:Uncharacterized protein n=1 Tax=Clonostachys chloroleuca TaxID=1926264 RepID=A0AA35MI21_9HYPO|nr:unnamed protein product [Clonostachys chloroleuca]